MNWEMDWIWGLPLIVLTVVIHAYGLALMNKKIRLRMNTAGRFHTLSLGSIIVMGGTALWTTILHAFEGGFGPSHIVSSEPCMTTDRPCCIRSAL